MKIKLATALAAMSLCGTAFSQSMWGTTSSITVALTFTYELPALQEKMVDPETGKLVISKDEDGKPIPTFENNYTLETYNSNGDMTKSVMTDEYGSKMAVSKFGNADILAYLVDSAVLEPKGSKYPFITGYSLIVVDDGETSMVYAKHTDRDTPLVPVDEFILGDGAEGGAFVATASRKSVETATFNPTTGAETYSSTFAYSETYKEAGFVSVPSFIGPVECSGLWTGTYKAVAKTETLDGEKYTTQVFVPGAAKFDKVVGVLEGDFGSEILEGTISLGAGAIVDVGALLGF